MTNGTDDKQHALYIEVTGNGPLDITVRLLRHDRLWDWRGEERNVLLATVNGGTFEIARSDRGLPEWRLCALDGETTDFEHDSSRFIDMTVVNPSLMSNWSDSIYVGVLTDARIWPIGVDLATASDGDTPAHECDGWPGKPGEHAPHRMAAYVPPEREEVDALMPSFVVVTTRPNLAFAQKADEWRREQAERRQAEQDDLLGAEHIGCVT
jgi:hypothetical protein